MGGATGKVNSSDAGPNDVEKIRRIDTDQVLMLIRRFCWCYSLDCFLHGCVFNEDDESPLHVFVVCFNSMGAVVLMCDLLCSDDRGVGLRFTQ